MLRISGLTLAMIAMVTPAVAQGKIVIDPNISRMPSITAPEATVSVDPRLAQKMTYTEGYTRLNTVVSDLGKASGVRLYCGQTPEDWQARDIPVIVYVKDMPLGKLLRAIADGTHTSFTTLRIGPKDEEKTPSYRICRPTKAVDSIVKQMEARYYAKFAEAEWGWDALAAFGRDPSLDNSKVGDWAPGFSKVLASLGEEGKKRVFAGQSVVVNTDTAPQLADALRQLYTNHIKPTDCTPEDLRKSEVMIRLSAVGDSDLQYLCGNFICHKPDSDTVEFSGYPISRCAEALKNVKGFKLPTRPSSELPKPEEDYPRDRLRILKTNEDWELPILKMKINMEAPKDKEHPTFSDAVITLAKASGFNIVCEDFQSHQDTQHFVDPDKFFVKETTLGEALRKLDSCYKPKWLNSEGGKYEPTWLINEKDKLIVGWANDWREHHYYIVPAKLVVDLREKMNGEGAKLDDIVPLVNLADRQLQEWIGHSPDIASADVWRSADDNSAWQLYAALSEEDKALVNSEAGLSLAKFEAKWLLSFFPKAKTLETHYALPNNEKTRAEVEVQLKKEFLTDPKLISRLVMRIPYRRLEHDLELVGEKDGESVVLKFVGPSGAFPKYSPKRDKEVHPKSMRP